MKRCKLILTATCICVGLTFIVLAAVLPPLLISYMKEEIRRQVKLTESKHSRWGEVPGKVHAQVYHDYHFFNLLNPDEVLFDGAVPVLEEKSGYIYKEYDNYINRTYTDYEGVDDAWVHFFPLQWVERTEEYPWNSTVSPEDNITTINVGAYGVWDQSKRLPPEQIAVSALYSLAIGFGSVMPLSIYAQFVRTEIPLYQFASSYILLPAGLDFHQAEAIWNDDRFGWIQWTTMQTWLQAYDENSVNFTFAYPSSPTGSLQLLMDYFDLSDVQAETLFHSLGKYYQVARILVKNNYACPTAEHADFCEGDYLGALQWSAQTVTLYPPLGLNPTASIAASNSSIYGYPEIAYYMQVQKIQGVEWTVEDYYRLFDYDAKTGWPSGSPDTLLDIGHMNELFAYGRAGNWSSMQTRFNLASEVHSEVLFAYLNSLVSLTALHNCTNPSIYNADNRGITSELSLGTFASQTLYGLVYGTMAEVMPLALTSMYGYARLVFELNLSCGLFVDKQETCMKTQLAWTSWQNFRMWVNAAWSGVGSIPWTEFLTIAQLTEDDMQEIFAETGYFAGNLTELEGELKLHYDCRTVGNRCFKYDLAERQWANSAISLNLPAALNLVNIANSTTILDWQLDFPAIPELNAYLASRNITNSLSSEQTRSLLSFACLLNAGEVQNLLIFDFAGNKSAMNSLLSGANPDYILNYLRFIVDRYAFNGLFVTKTVDEWLWTGIDPLLQTVHDTNPLLGGNPAINPASVQLGQNQSVAYFQQFSPDLRAAMNTGETDLDQLRWWRLFNGVPYNNVLQQVYMGHNAEGAVIEWVAVNPWKVEVPLVGGDAWTFQPQIDSNSNISLYLNQNSRNANCDFLDTITIDGFDCYRFIVGANPLLVNTSQVPGNDVFFQYAPMGLVNQTSVLGSPLFGSKPYFLNGTD